MLFTSLAFISVYCALSRTIFFTETFIYLFKQLCAQARLSGHYFFFMQLLEPIECKLNNDSINWHASHMCISFAPSFSLRNNILHSILQPWHCATLCFALCAHLQAFLTHYKHRIY